MNLSRVPISSLSATSRKTTRDFLVFLMGKRLFSGDASTLPENLRCRRSDGRQWRCPQPAKSGISFCEYHYHQVRRNQGSIKNANVMTEASGEIKRRRLLSTGTPLSRKRRRKRQRKGSPLPELTGLENMEKGMLESGSSDLKVRMDVPWPDGLRHHQTDGMEWRCSPPVMPALSYVLHDFYCKQHSEEKAEVIESKPKRRARRAAYLLPSRQRRRRPRSNLEDLTKEPVKMARKEDGECDIEAAYHAVSRNFAISDTLRCMRSDGRKWRCPQPVVSGLSFCEYHQMRCKQTFNKNTKVKISNPDRVSHLATDSKWNTKRQYWLRLMGERRAEDLTWIEKDEEALESAKPATPGLRVCRNVNKSKAAEQAMVSVEATERAAPDMMATEPATPDMEFAKMAMPDLLCRTEGNNKLKETSSMPKCRLHLPGNPQPSKRVISLPDYLRCRRSDGRKWRCTQLALPSVGFCEYHHLQMRRNQGKSKKTKFNLNAKWKHPVRVELLGKVRTMIEQEGGEKLEASNLEILRDLPNGVMAISPGLVKGQSNASSSLDRKLGSDDEFLLGRLFRSKNAERVPLAKVQKLPFFRSMGGRRKRVCHSCRASEKKVAGRNLCLSCQEFFCPTCMETWHPELSEFDVKQSCPVCRGCCNCINCNLRRDEDETSK